MPIWHPRPEDVQQVLDDQNPWHRSGSVPESLARPVERPVAQRLWKRLLDDDPHRFHIVLGPRRVGKSTALYQTVRHLLAADVPPSRIWWLRLDHPLLIPENLGNLVRTVVQTTGADADTPVYLMLDELVYTRDWDLWLKTFFDDRWPVRIAATSSATAALRERRLESGVGRWAEQYLTPYLFTEYLSLVGADRPVDVGSDLADTIARTVQGDRADPETAKRRRTFMLVGGFPELLDRDHARWLSRGEPGAAPEEADRLFESQQVLRADAVERALYKDIPQSFGVNDPMLLERLLYVLAAQVTGLLSPSNICSDLGMSQPTFDRYLSYLERAFLVFTLPNYSGNESTVQKRGRKLYFVDGAVRNAALQRGLAPLDNPDELGVLLENLAAATLRSLALHTGVRVHHWRDGKDEVDLIYNHPDRPVAFEIGLSAAHTRSGLAALMDKHPQFVGRCYLVAPDAKVAHPETTSTRIGTLPLDTYLLAVGAQADVALASNLGPVH